MIIFDNSEDQPNEIGKKVNDQITIHNKDIWNQILQN